MYHYTYFTEKTCANVITLDLDGDKVHNITFLGGCNGNLKTIPLLLEGESVDEIERKLKGIECGRRGTSCSDQLALAVRAAYNAQLNGEVQDFDE